jgi:hypothetical protein
MRTLLKSAVVLALVSSASFVNAASPTIRDEFDATTVSDSWFSCSREENNFSFGKIKGEERTAASRVVRGLPQNNVLAFAWLPKGCARENGSYDRDGSERSEFGKRRKSSRLWEQIYGTDLICTSTPASRPPPDGL